MKYRLPGWHRGQCLVYGRVSKDTQDASLADQYGVIRECMREAKLAEIRAPFEDDGERGHDEERPGLLAVIEYARTHPNRVRHNDDFIPILVYNVARFGRFDDSKKIFYYLVQIEKHGYEFYSVMEGLRSRGNISEFVQLIIRGEQAYQYTLDLSEYGIRTGCSLAEKGWWPGGNPPYGYDRMTFGPDGKPRYRYVSRPDKTVDKQTPDGKLIESFPPVNDKGKLRSAYSDKLKTDKVKLLPNPEFSKVVQMIFDWFVLEDWGIKRIAAKLNSLGIPAPRGRKWLKGSVRGVLLNPAHKGALVYGRRSDGKHHDVNFERLGDRYVLRMTRRDVAVREFVHRSYEECIVVEQCHGPIVSSELWDRAQKKFALRKNGQLGFRGKGGRGSQYLLSGDGLMKCARCGYHFHGSTDRTSKIRYYLDGGYHMGGAEVCDMTLVPAGPLEAVVLDWIRKAVVVGPSGLFKSEEDLVSEIERTLETDGVKLHAPSPKVDILERKLGDLRKKREDAERLAREFGQEASHLVGRIRAEESAVANELAGLRNAEGSGFQGRNSRKVAEEIVRYQLSMEEAFQQGTADERKRFIRDFVAGIEVDGKERKVRISFYEDPEKSALRVVPRTGFEPVLSA